MSKKKKSKTKKSKTKQKNILFKSKTVKVPLKKKLSDIYNEINLETTCKGICDCCKVAMPQLNYCEFIQLLSEVWDTEDIGGKKNIIKQSVEYFFRHEFEKWGKESLTKPCMLLSEDGKCKYYTSRPLSCRMYGLWPEKEYNERVDKFEKAYEGLLTREELPLHTQCPHVKRVDNSVELTTEVIQSLYYKLDDLDANMKMFSSAQINNKENYRTFHDWFLFIFFGETWLIAMTDFIVRADLDMMKDQLEQIKIAIDNKYTANNIPDLGISK